jgi:hypothetical protein
MLAVTVAAIARLAVAVVIVAYWLWLLQLGSALFVPSPQTAAVDILSNGSLSAF